MQSVPKHVVVTLAFAVSTVVLLSTTGYSQDDSRSIPMGLTKISEPIRLDGRMDDAAWQTVTPLPITMYEPVFEGEMTEKTTVRVAYDDSYLYIAGELRDSDPDGVRANSLYRDRYSGDDVLAIVLDTFNDNENALWFVTTPSGVRIDMGISADAEGMSSTTFGSANLSWNTYWDVATRQTTEGWFAEVRIPFSSLGFQTVDGIVDMGMLVYRLIARKNERHLFPAVPPNWSMSYAKPSQAQKIRLDDVYAQTPIYVTPYATGGIENRSQLDASQAAYERDNTLIGDLGGDVKVNLTSNLTLDLTVNTDFAQVEADDQQVNLTRFSLFFPEKRQFFQERAGIFDFRTQGGFGRLFHSRRIGIHQGGTVPILGGARLVGRSGNWDFGVLNMQTADVDGSDGRSELPSENFGVFTARRRIINDNSYLGSMITTRLGMDGSYNFGFGLNGDIKLVRANSSTCVWPHPPMTIR